MSLRGIGGSSGPIEGPGEPQRDSTAITYDQNTLPTELSPTQQMLPPGPLPEVPAALAQALALKECSWPKN